MQNKRKLNDIVVVFLKHASPPCFFYSYYNVTNQGTNTFCNIQRSLLPDVFPNLQSSQSLQEVSPAEVRNQTNGNDDSSGGFIFCPDFEEQVNASLHLNKTLGLSDSY